MYFKFWTSGQWMTEKRGGSDVGGGTETRATHVRDDIYRYATCNCDMLLGINLINILLVTRLSGYKWFSSATDSDMSFTLARTDNTDKLSMFFLKTRNEEGQLNNIQVNNKVIHDIIS